VSYAVAGRHAEMVYEPHVQAIADRLRADLATLGDAALAR
jgi:thioesterase domain-containing protein